MSVRTFLQHGPKGRKFAAVALDWPGWSRGAKDPDVAVETLEAYRERYRPVARLAGLESEFEAAGPLDIVEEATGTGMTDFWGISFASSSLEHGPMPDDELERRLSLLQAAWRFFDEVAARVSPELRKGARGGGRDRDEIIRHVFGSEREEYAKKVGVRTEPGAMLTPDGLRTHREQYVAGIREHNVDGRAGRFWTLRFLIRHNAYHVLDHAWEMEDKDLS
jgi:hypothetical protein